MCACLCLCMFVCMYVFVHVNLFLVVRAEWWWLLWLLWFSQWCVCVRMPLSIFIMCV